MSVSPQTEPNKGARLMGRETDMPAGHRSTILAVSAVAALVVALKKVGTTPTCLAGGSGTPSGGTQL